MKYLKIFTDFRSAMEPLTDEEAGRLFRAMLLYAENGTESELLGGERYLWNVARQNIDREAEAYAAKTGILRENGKRGLPRVGTVPSKRMTNAFLTMAKMDKTTTIPMKKTMTMKRAMIFLFSGRRGRALRRRSL